jgi:hypothetical protein
VVVTFSPPDAVVPAAGLDAPAGAERECDEDPQPAIAKSAAHAASDATAASDRALTLT